MIEKSKVILNKSVINSCFCPVSLILGCFWRKIQICLTDVATISCSEPPSNAWDDCIVHKYINEQNFRFSSSKSFQKILVHHQYQTLTVLPENKIYINIFYLTSIGTPCNKVYFVHLLKLLAWNHFDSSAKKKKRIKINVL